MQQLREKLDKASGMMNSGKINELINDRNFELVEALPVNYYGEGLEYLKSSLRMRQVVALKRWEGENDYCLADLIKEAVGGLRLPGLH